MDPFTICMALFVLLPIILLVLFVLYQRSRVEVASHEVGVKVVDGEPVGTLGPGVHWVSPFKATVVRFDIRSLTVDAPTLDFEAKGHVPITVHWRVVVRVKDPVKVLTERTGDVRERSAETARRVLVGLLERHALEEAQRRRTALAREAADDTRWRLANFGIELLELAVYEIRPRRARG